MPNRLPTALILLVLVVATGLYAQDPPTLPTVVATAPRIGGGNILCRGTACRGVIQALSGPDYYVSELPLMPDQGTKPLSKAEFCANLKQAKPPNCSYSNPPSAPGYDPNWIANGCGDGTFASDFGAKLAGFILPDHTGNLNNPLPGISFYGACAGHDRCYASTGSFSAKNMCDTMFKSTMRMACDAGSSTYSSQCDTIKNAYVSAVQTPFGDAAYDEAQTETACAAWASDMETNGCPP